MEEQSNSRPVEVVMSAVDWTFTIGDFVWSTLSVVGDCLGSLIP